jgi:folate-binding protein YgfZ
VDFGEDTYPQEAGLKTRAVSFNKGCYLGQEVICMLENRGQLSRRLVQLSASGELAVEPGSLVFDADGKRVGELTSVAVTDGAQPTTLALAYLKRPLAELGRTVRAADHSFDVSAVVGLATEECPIVARGNE